MNVSDITQLLERSAESGNHLDKTLSDILEFANLESGTLLLSREAVEVPVLFDGVSRMFAHTAAQKGVKIVVELPESVPYVDADAEQADLLMQKLVENAVEFCPPNSRVEMRGTLVRDGSALVISVVDEGPGIDREHREVIFESFRQIESGHTRSHPGVGLGLAIARQIARAHQTDVAVESEPGSGSTFSVEFPVASASLGENS
jgi:two-component system phosphate regulon sensor histidine kinase PhoR